MQKKSIWTVFSGNALQEPIILKSEFIKKGSRRYLMATEKSVILFKDADYRTPLKVLPLNFETKFEVIRTCPKMKGTCSPVKLSAQARPDQVKSENIESLGEIIQIAFMREEDLDNKYVITSDTETLQQWRLFLGKKLNQIGFHHLFKVFRKIGKGNFASVYYAERVEDGQQMAIKAFSKSVAYGEENGKAGLVNEIELMRQLDHPNIIKLYECHETQNSLYICLELLDGGQLYDYMKKKVIFQNKEIQIIIKGLLQGLEHIHSKDIMHRDIKLENILFKQSNQINSVCLADFGLATNQNDPVYLYCRCGTPGFVAPEVINIKDLTTRYDKVCDIYSLGLVFHLIVTGKPAFPGRSYTTIVNQNKEAKITWKSSMFDVIPKSALDLMQKMLEKDPTKRITATEALNHDYFNILKIQLDDDEPIGDESTQMEQRMLKINEINNQFDKMRINQLNNSPIRSPYIRATQTAAMKESVHGQEETPMIMHTPVMTGRMDDLDDSPDAKQMKSVQMQKKHKRQESSSILQKYTNNAQEEQPQKKEVQEEVLNIKIVQNQKKY